MKKKILMLCFSTFIFNACSSGNNSDQNLEEIAVVEELDETPVTELEIEEESNWKYSDSEDKMTGHKKYFAYTYSPDRLYFDFPYNVSGGSMISLNIRKNNGLDIYLAVSKGQFISGIYDRTIRVKFDNGPVENYSTSSTSDGSSDVLFIRSEKKFLGKLKKSQKVMIEPEFYDAGLKPVTFNVEGLDWSH